MVNNCSVLNWNCFTKNVIYTPVTIESSKQDLNALKEGVVLDAGIYQLTKWGTNRNLS